MVISLITFPHFIIMLLAIIFFTGSITMVIAHKPKNWFLLHKFFASVGVLTAIIGVISLGGLVLEILHGILGLIITIIFIGVIFLGLFAIKKKEKKVRSAHILISRITYIISLFLVILGIITLLYL